MPRDTFDIPAEAHRQAEITGLPAEGAREVEVSFSSDEPVERFSWFDDEVYLEVLGHDEGEVDLARLQSGNAPLLKDHRPSIDSAIGVVTRAWVEGGRGKALVRFSSTPAAEDVLERVRSGDVSNVSVGYDIRDARRDGRQDGKPVVRVTSWVPKEISLVAIPADPTVGVGRANGAGARVTVKTRNETMPKENQNEGGDGRRNEAGTPPGNPPHGGSIAAPAPAQARGDDDAERRRAVEAAVAADRGRVAEIEAIAGQFDMPAEAVRKAKENGTSVADWREIVLRHITSAPSESSRAGATRIGMSDREIESYSIMRAVRALANPRDTRAREAAAFEFEASAAAAERSHKDPRGVMVPADVLMQRGWSSRADVAGKQNTINAAEGGAIVAENYMPGSFIDLLRNRLATMAAGARMITGLVGDVDIPRKTAGSTHYWVGEGEDVPDSLIGLGSIKATPHTIGVAVPITRRLLIQSTPDIEALVRADMIAEAALGIDLAALAGNPDADAPASLRSQVPAGNVIQWGAAGRPTYPELVDLEALVDMANVPLDAVAYVYNAAITGALKTQEQFAGGGLPIEADGEVNGYRRIKTGQAGDGDVYFGNFSDLILCYWTGLDLTVDTATLAASGGVVLRAFQDVDTIVRRTESFSRGENPV
jgi:HK97 family phage major capsid protein/HK97 family phage prohead protease